MQHFKNIATFYKAINIEPPKNTYFDVRRFEDNMTNLSSILKPVKHNFFGISLKLDGNGKATYGPFNKLLNDPSIMVNTPFQIISWDITLNWKGYYIIFTEEFIAQSKLLNSVINEFDYFKLDKAIPFEITKKEALKLLKTFEDLYEENNNKTLYSTEIIESQLIVLLNFVKRLYTKHINLNQVTHNSKTETKSLLKFQSLLNSSFEKSNTSYTNNTHSPSYYAELLAIHPNHLNAIIKQTTGKTTKSLINNHIINLAKSRLIQTTLSIKEIAYELHFKTPNSFSSFFKKYTNLTPNRYRKKHSL